MENKSQEITNLNHKKKSNAWCGRATERDADDTMAVFLGRCRELEGNLKIHLGFLKRRAESGRQGNKKSTKKKLLSRKK